ncbi:MAG: DoxX family protein, partial [Deltaproteobacteria bacterium]|nr:DoxX family protein [Nannocystaceae bacterium]
MRTRKIAYVVTTALFALAMLGSAFADLTHPAQITEGFARLGLPLYLATMLGVWKLLGVAAIAAPGLPRLKEWAYAGFFFELSGAVVMHAIFGEPVFVPLALALLGMASWALRPNTRMLGSI